MTRREWLEKRYRTEKERDVRFSTVSDMEVEPVYTADDLAPDAPERVGLPGEFPYTRGVYASMYRGRVWTMRQFAGFGTAEDTNGRYVSASQSALARLTGLPSLIALSSRMRAPPA